MSILVEPAARSHYFAKLSLISRKLRAAASAGAVATAAALSAFVLAVLPPVQQGLVASTVEASATVSSGVA